MGSGFFDGQAVRLKTNICSEREQRLVYIISGIIPERQEAFITCINSFADTVPTWRVSLQDIESL